jgi:hypothetical protein
MWTGYLDRVLDESASRKIFNTYSTDQATLNHTQISTFTQDLLISANLPPIALHTDKIINELQIEHNNSNLVTWNDFKSYLMYLGQAPLRQLIHIAYVQLEYHATVYISALPEHADAGIVKCAIEELFPNVSVVGEVFVQDHCAIVCLENVQQRDIVLRGNGSAIGGHPVKIQVYDNQFFPPRKEDEVVDENHSIAAQALAQTMLFGKKIEEKAKNIDSQLKITDSIHKFDSEHKISQTAKSGFKAVAEKSSAVWSDIDKKTKISSKMKKASQKIKENEVVQSGWGKLQGFLSNVSSQASSLKSEAKQIVSQKTQDSPKKADDEHQQVVMAESPPQINFSLEEEKQEAQNPPPQYTQSSEEADEIFDSNMKSYDGKKEEFSEL